MLNVLLITLTRPCVFVFIDVALKEKDVLKSRLSAALTGRSCQRKVSRV